MELERYVKRIALLACLALGNTLLTVPATAATPREQELLNRVQQLEARLATIEKMLTEKAAPDAGALEQRIAKLEATETARGSSNNLTALWKDGLNFKSDDGDFKLKVGGRIMWDWLGIDPDDDLDDALELEDGTEFRRARLFMSGTLYDHVAYKAQYDFADDGTADFKDVWLGLTGLGNGDYDWGLKLGHFKEPFSLNELTSSKYITFMERGLPNAFAPGRSPGIMAYGNLLDERLTWALGYFQLNADDEGEDIEPEDKGAFGNRAFTGRVTGLPFYADKGKLLHVGLAASHRALDEEDGDTVRFRARPEIHLGDRFVDTGSLPADDVLLLGAEVAGIYGPFHAEAEYIYADVDADEGYDDPDFDGFYVQAGYFLTGESRPYKAGLGVMNRVKPNRNFLVDGGWGAWEIAARYSQLDLDDEVEGGELEDITLGVNWYLNPNTRVMLNYIHAMLEHEGLDVDGNSDAVQARFQLDF